MLKLNGHPFFKTSFTSWPSISIIAFEWEKSVTAKSVSFKFCEIFLVSFGAFTILMYLIKNNSASKTVSIFFLIPATSAFMAWLFLNESLTNLDLLGFLITTIGVYIATRD